jgi:hypothetical protein
MNQKKIIEEIQSRKGIPVRMRASSLKGFDFSGMDLSDADLSYSNLSEANFDGANGTYALRRPTWRALLFGTLTSPMPILAIVISATPT